MSGPKLSKSELYNQQHMNKALWYSALTFLGVIPFVFFLLLEIFAITMFEIFGTPIDLANSYGLVIISFMSGVLWGLYLGQTIMIPTNLFLISNLIAIAAWIMYLLVPAWVSLIGFAIGFIILLVIDFNLLQRNIINKHYFLIRASVSSMVIVSISLLSAFNISNVL